MDQTNGPSFTQVMDSRGHWQEAESDDVLSLVAPFSEEHVPIRRDSRHAFRIPTLIHILDQSISGHTENLSVGGFRLIAEVGLKAGQPLTLQFVLGAVCQLSLSGLVAYCLPMIRRDRPCYAIGLKLTATGMLDRQILGSVIEEIYRGEESQRPALLHLFAPREALVEPATKPSLGTDETDAPHYEQGIALDRYSDRVSARDLLPKSKRANYSPEAAQTRRDWLAAKCGTPLRHIGTFTENPENLRGNVEHFIGAAQIPLGIAGPLRVNGQFAKGNFYVPMATTEGALVYTCNESMLLISMAGGATTAVLKDALHISPIFMFDSVRAAQRFSSWVEASFDTIKQHAQTATRHGELLSVEPHIFDRNVVVKFCYSTGDAMGINMITFATEAACEYILQQTKPRRYYLQPNFSSIKKVTAHNFITGYGKTVIAEATIPASLIKRTFHVQPQAIVDFYHAVRLCTAHVGMTGINGHTANLLAAVFTACGQDIACVVDSYVGVTNFELTDDGSLYVSLKLPSLLVGTVGGGTQLATQRECLQLLGCEGAGKAAKFSEILAAATLASEIGICARVANGTFANAHRKYGRKPSGTALGKSGLPGGSMPVLPED